MKAASLPEIYVVLDVDKEYYRGKLLSALKITAVIIVVLASWALLQYYAPWFLASIENFVGINVTINNNALVTTARTLGSYGLSKFQEVRTGISYLMAPEGREAAQIFLSNVNTYFKKAAFSSLSKGVAGALATCGFIKAVINLSKTESLPKNIKQSNDSSQKRDFTEDGCPSNGNSKKFAPRVRPRSAEVGLQEEYADEQLKKVMDLKLSDPQKSGMFLGPFTDKMDLTQVIREYYSENIGKKDPHILPFFYNKSGHWIGVVLTIEEGNASILYMNPLSKKDFSKEEQELSDFLATSTDSKENDLRIKSTKSHINNSIFEGKDTNLFEKINEALENFGIGAVTNDALPAWMVRQAENDTTSCGAACILNLYYALNGSKGPSDEERKDFNMDKNNRLSTGAIALREHFNELLKKEAKTEYARTR